MNPAPKTALYARVSSKDGRQDFENQLAQLRELANHRGYKIVGEYTDEETGSKARSGLNRLIDDARKGKIELVLFWSLDRLSREGALRTLQYLDDLTRYGCEWRSLTEAFFDSLGPFRDGIIGLVATIAKMERSRIQERTKAGLERARKNGKVLGRPMKIVDAAELDRLHRNGIPIRIIAQQYNLASNTVRNRIHVWRLEQKY